MAGIPSRQYSRILAPKPPSRSLPPLIGGHANRLTAMKLLQAKLFELKRRQEEERLAALNGEQREIAWGSQIRSYVFQPCQLVKDHRTGSQVLPARFSFRARQSFS